MIRDDDRNTLATLWVEGIRAPIDRIPFGSEARADMIPPGRCHDCFAERGEIHKLGCDMEACPHCGGQLLSCDCEAASRIGYVQAGAQGE